MRKLAAEAKGEVKLRLVVNKPEPELHPKETEILNAILEKGISYDKPLCIDSVDGPRQTHKIRFNVVLATDKTKMDLYLFLKNDAGISLIEAGTSGETILEAMMEAEGRNIVRLKELK